MTKLEKQDILEHKLDENKLQCKWKNHIIVLLIEN